jgi:hypothetical protein
MPPTEYDPSELARLLGEGKSLHEIADIVDGPKVDEAAAAQRRSLQEQRGALNAEAAPPGQEPEADPVEGMIAAARRSGAPRGSERYMEAGFESLFAAAQAGDARVTTQGTVDRETAERWHGDAIQRQVRNRDRSGVTKPR